MDEQSEVVIVETQSSTTRFLAKLAKAAGLVAAGFLAGAVLVRSTSTSTEQS